MTTIDTINALFRPLDEAIAETRRITDELAGKGKEKEDATNDRLAPRND